MDITKKRLNDLTPADWDDVFRATQECNEEDSLGWDVVDKPKHYNTNGGIECIEYIKERLGSEVFVNYCEGNVIKYVHRWKDKNGLEDLKKARWYIDRMIKELQ